MNYIKGFDALRGVSILLVVLTHLGLNGLLPDHSFIQTRVWSLISGLTGVYIFFTLSGFLITTILLKEKSKTNSIGLTNFYIRRFLRLLPALFILYLLVIFSMAFGYIEWNITGLLFSFFYVYNFIPNDYYSGELAHTWSLAVEEQFYLFWPFIISFIGSFKKWIYLIIVIVLTCIAATYLLEFVVVPLNGKSYVLKYIFHLERLFIPAVGPIMIGCLGAILVHFYNRQLLSLFEHNKFYFVLAVILFGSPLFIPAALLPASFIFQAVGIVLLLMWIYYNNSSRVTNFLQHTPLTYVGKISYGIYVYQGFFLRTGPGGEPFFQHFPLNIILTIGFAVLSYEYVEKYFLKQKTRFKTGYVSN